MTEKLIDLEDIKVVQNDRNKEAIAVVNGTEEEFTNLMGKKQKRMKWFWLPRSLTEIHGDGTVTIPLWLAEDKGLV